MSKTVVIAAAEQPQLELSEIDDWRIERAACGARPAPSDMQALILAGDTDAEAGGELIDEALSRKVPVLAMGTSMYTLNARLLGQAAVGKSHAESEESVSVFIAPGAKLAKLVGGSGWLKMPVSSLPAVRLADLSSGTMPVCISSDGTAYGFELPGAECVIGLYWNTLSGQKLPRGFDKIISRFLSSSD